MDDKSAGVVMCLQQEVEKYRDACIKIDGEVQQILGKALHYPWFKDDQKNFPNATEKDGVCVGEHVAQTIAAEAAERIVSLEKEVAYLNEILEDMPGDPMER